MDGTSPAGARERNRGTEGGVTSQYKKKKRALQQQSGWRGGAWGEGVLRRRSGETTPRASSKIPPGQLRLPGAEISGNGSSADSPGRPQETQRRESDKDEKAFPYLRIWGDINFGISFSDHHLLSRETINLT